MSVYDKYFSEINKKHMFSLVRDIILKEVSYDINYEVAYNDLFQRQYVNVFEETLGETLIDCNRDVIDHICPRIIDDILKKRNVSVNTDTRGNPLTAKNIHMKTIKISSGKRNINEHRFSYTLKPNDTSDDLGTLRKLIIPEEENILFGHPVINVHIRPGPVNDDIDTCVEDNIHVCELSESRQLGSRTYHTYICDSQINISGHSNYHCILRNSEGLSPFIDTMDTDTYQIVSLKNIYHSRSYLCVQLHENQNSFRAKDTLSLFSDGIDKSIGKSLGTTRILEIKGPYLLCQPIHPERYKECMSHPKIHIRNISLQSTLVFDV